MMHPHAQTIFDEALQVAAFPTHEAVAELKLQMASGMAHYAYIRLDIDSVEYTQLQNQIQNVRLVRADKKFHEGREELRNVTGDHDAK